MTRSTLTHALWRAVRNDEGRWSVWPVTRPLPAGWHPEGEPALRDACLARIADVWSDPRPLALRAAMEDVAALRPKEAQL